ncbi:MAG: betaine-aldehyde dehydrogenase [Mycobacterium sp.]|jgi:aldehyde dehydrogenase (NAD+)|nr:betaine-aldehyde dehydrogenase [Mycobacterium sp.]
MTASTSVLLNDLLTAPRQIIGEDRRMGGGPTRGIENPRTCETIATISDANAVDVTDAVAAAETALSDWSRTEVGTRVRLLSALAAQLSAVAPDLATLIELEQGSPPPLARRLHVDLAIEVVSSIAELLPSTEFERVIANSRVVREPVGVVAAITPWNLPLYQVAVKLAPLLAAGCTVVLKPSELTPLSALAFAHAARNAGFPPGVINVVTGAKDVAVALASEKSISMISFTGSTEVGRQIAGRAAATVKRCTLELGGKSPSIILPNCDDTLLETAVKLTVGNCFLNGGQTCTALSRLLVPRKHAEAVAEMAAEFARKYVPGDRLGPLISAPHRDRVLDYIRLGSDQGARLLIGGTENPQDLPDLDHYVWPTVFAGVDPTTRIAQEEIFGPVLSIITYDEVDEAIRFANGTIYGLTSAIWGTDPDQAKLVAQHIRAGQVDINAAAFNTRAPFGGYGQSGLGRELGVEGILDCTEIKSIQQ